MRRPRDRDCCLVGAFFYRRVRTRRSLGQNFKCRSPTFLPRGRTPLRRLEVVIASYLGLFHAFFFFFEIAVSSTEYIFSGLLALIFGCCMMCIFGACPCRSNAVLFHFLAYSFSFFFSFFLYPAAVVDPKVLPPQEGAAPVSKEAEAAPAPPGQRGATINARRATLRARIIRGVVVGRWVNRAGKPQKRELVRYTLARLIASSVC